VTSAQAVALYDSKAPAKPWSDLLAFDIGDEVVFFGHDADVVSQHLGVQKDYAHGRLCAHVPSGLFGANGHTLLEKGYSIRRCVFNSNLI